MKDYILNTISMKDLLYKYGIKTNRDMFCCPFHNDKSPSAKAYKNDFHCFGCGANSDVIGFVEKYFNLNFKEAMQKINEDFYLGLESNTKVDYTKINEIKRQHEEKKRYENKLYRQFSEKCSKKLLLERERKFLKERINLYNIDEILKFECKLRDMQWQLENEIENIEKKITTI